MNGSSAKRRRLQCPLCKETLSYSAYCRHQQTQSCVPTQSKDSNEASISTVVVPNCDLSNDMSDFCSDDFCCIRDTSASLKNNSSNEDDIDSTMDSEESCTEDDFAPEVWDDKDIDSESDAEGDSSATVAAQSALVKRLIHVLSFLLLFFQLCYHVSDRGLRYVLSMISSIFHWISVLVPENETIKQIASIFPKTLYSLRKQIENSNSFKKYCVCPVCDSLYPLGEEANRKCTFVPYPNHPQATFRSECGTELMKRIKVRNKYKLVPRKLFLYNSITNSLEKFACRPGFFESCEAWRNLSSMTNDSFMTDVYDGKIWKEWKHFLDMPGNLLLMLNVDWFRPYKHTVYSVGVIYLVIQNLPRTIRFKPENIMIVGTIPGPHEPKLTINTYLKPMIDELLQLWKGVQIKSDRSLLGTRRIRVALAYICSDIPATRKLCGFYGFKAKHGCSKCMKSFPTGSFSDSSDYSGFQRTQWPQRDIRTHQEQAHKAKSAATKSAKTAIERKFGIRYSDLLRLPYLNVVRCHLIDPMHNLFLGTAKNVMTLWKSNKILSDSDFIAIQDKMDSFAVPAHIGRLPGKIASGFSGFTAEQWMVWTIVFSPFILKDYLPIQHYSMWCTFSLSCSLLCRPFIKHAELVKADELIIKFCEMFEQVFGKEHVTPNMHLHAHIRECVEDVGPVFSFWCFSFERYNGILESFQKNWHAPEIQLLEKFVLMQTLNAMNVSAPPELSSCVDSVRKNYTMLEDARRIFNSSDLLTYERNIMSLPTAVNGVKLDLHEIILPRREKYLTEPSRQNLQKMYSAIYGEQAVNHVPLRYEEFSDLKVLGELYTSLKSRSHGSAAIMAMWPGLNGKIIIRTCTSEDVRTGQIDFFLLHTPKINGVPDRAHVLAKVIWYEDHPRKFIFSNSITLSSTLSDRDCEASFIPVSRVMSRCATAKQSLTFDYGEDNVIVCLPLHRRID